MGQAVWEKESHMVKGLYTAHTGMVNEIKRLDIMTNNLANADTTAYKKEGTTSRTFGEELAIRVKDTSSYGLNRPIGDIAYGVHLGQVYTDWDEGSFKVTDKETDFAISGKGFFAVSFTDKAGNTSYKLTRDGSFTVNAQGYLVTKDGDYVLNQNGALTGNPAAGNYVQLDPNAKIFVNEAGQVFQNEVLVDQIGLVDVANYDDIIKYGENLYNLAEGAQLIAPEGATVQQGILETSNVNVVKEMVNMITIQRAYEAGQKVITSIDETLEPAVNTVGRVQ